LRKNVLQTLFSRDSTFFIAATLPDIKFDLTADDDNAINLQRGDSSNNMPVIRKKEHDYLGMFEYKRDQEQQVLKALIYGEKLHCHFLEFAKSLNFVIPDLKPKTAVQMLPGLPAYILFMMIRYTDYVNNDENVRSLIQGAISLVKKVIKKKGMNDLEVRNNDLFSSLFIAYSQIFFLDRSKRCGSLICCASCTT
jgi:hypothetical protein